MASGRKIIFIFIILASLAAAGCTTLPDIEPVRAAAGPAEDTLVSANHAAVDQLLASLMPPRGFNKSQPIIVATLVNVDNLNGSRLGRVLSEQIATRLTMKGFSVIELKLRDNIFINEKEGELLLSRKIKDISLNHNAQAVVVGTYAESSGYVYVTVKMVDSTDGQVMAAHDYALPLDANIRSLLRGGVTN